MIHDGNLTISNVVVAVILPSTMDTHICKSAHKHERPEKKVETNGLDSSYSDKVVPNTVELESNT